MNEIHKNLRGIIEFMETKCVSKAFLGLLIKTRSELI